MVYGSAGKSGDPGNVQSVTSGENWGINVSNPPSPPEFPSNCENIVLTVADSGKPSFFISRAGADHEWGLWIAEVLREKDYDYFLQDDHIPHGSFVEHMKEGMERCPDMIAVLSQDYFSNEHTRGELNSQYARDPLGVRHKLILVRVGDCETPKLFADLVYLDLAEKNEQAKRMLLARITGERRSVKAADGFFRAFTSRLPTVDPTLIGREEQLAFLDRAWSDPAANFVQIIAAGGTGKTALADKWFRAHIDEATVFGWSFYSQGTSEDRQTSSDPFFAEILTFFGTTVPATASVYAKAEAIAQRLREERVLLILDGIEPLQDSGGALRDQGLKALLQELATKNKGLVLCTTRVRIEDVPDDPPRALAIDLDNLDPEHGAEYLRHFKVEGTEEELREASAEYGNHALALTLLGSYLADFCDGDVRRRVEIPALMVVEVKQGAHARRVMEGYARMFAGKPELDILRALGYFDRPAEPAALKLVLPDMQDRTYRAALKRLRDARLILTADPTALIDCHPLVREHFADVMRKTAPDGFREGHSRLYEHYCKQAPPQPDTLDEMTPLFYAVYHGCQAGRHSETRRDVYRDRINRGGEFYLTKQLGAFGADFSLVANFFEVPWSKPVATLSTAEQGWVISVAAFVLRVLGRLADAVEPMQASAESARSLDDWTNAAIRYGNLSENHLALGNVQKAIATARQSVGFADRSGDAFQRFSKPTTLADALHQSGATLEAADLFDEAERIQGELHPGNALLSSVQGYQYCDLLLTQGKTTEGLRRATQSLALSERYKSLLSIGLYHVSLGRSYPVNSPESARHLDQAVDYLRRSGQLDNLPLALLARGTQRDLDEVLKIVTRSGMRLHLTDYHLAQARLYIRENRLADARPHIEKAAKLIEETGYHRRDAELAELLKLTAQSASPQ
jgi:tetratricopeptide (TPR) repeat protein